MSMYSRCQNQNDTNNQEMIFLCWFTEFQSKLMQNALILCVSAILSNQLPNTLSHWVYLRLYDICWKMVPFQQQGVSKVM